MENNKGINSDNIGDGTETNKGEFGSFEEIIDAVDNLIAKSQEITEGVPEGKRDAINLDSPYGITRKEFDIPIIPDLNKVVLNMERVLSDGEIDYIKKGGFTDSPKSKIIAKFLGDNYLAGIGGEKIGVSGMILFACNVSYDISVGKFGGGINRGNKLPDELLSVTQEDFNEFYIQYTLYATSLFKDEVEELEEAEKGNAVKRNIHTQEEAEEILAELNKEYPVQEVLGEDLF